MLLHACCQQSLQLFLFARRKPAILRRSKCISQVMKAVLRIARQFEVSIDSSYAALVIGMVVLVGFATSMDPNVNLMDAAAPAFLQNNLLGQVTGRLYS